VVMEEEQPRTELRYFAHVENGVVDFVTTYSQCECFDNCNVACEREAQTSLQEVATGIWVQTWKGGGLRKHYAHVGGTYDPDRNAFIPPQTYPSWVLNDDSLVWEPPVPHPTNFTTSGWIWDEDALTWVEIVPPS